MYEWNVFRDLIIDKNFYVPFSYNNIKYLKANWTKLIIIVLTKNY
jgi:hypothetical protein